MTHNTHRRMASNKENTSPRKDSFQKFKQLQKIKNQVVYHKYLGSLRSVQNKNPSNLHSNKSQNQLPLRFRQASKQIIKGMWKWSNQQIRRSHIKWSSQLNQNIINDEVVELSDKMDRHLQSNLHIPTRQQLKKTHQSRQLQFAVINNENQANFEVSYQNAQKGIADQQIHQKISKLIVNDIQSLSLNRSNSQKSLSKSLFSQIAFKLHQRDSIPGRIFQKTEPNGKNKRNSNNSQLMCYQQQKKRAKRVHASESDLNQMMEKYNNKRIKYGKVKGYMTMARDEGIFMNEALKMARKFQTVDILTMIAARDQPSLNQTYQQNKICAAADKLTGFQLKEACKQNFQYHRSLALQKL